MRFSCFLAATALMFCGGAAAAECPTGLYHSPDGGLDAALYHTSSGSARYTLSNGDRGAVGGDGARLTCVGDELRTATGQQPGGDWARVPLRMTETHFDSHGTSLAGILIEPPTPGPHPLVVFVHGSEHFSPRETYYPYLFAARGISVFAYDKRGTAGSEGEYTQNFELLADDAAAALGEARRIGAGRISRAGFFGGSQGGWVAPLAATRAPAEFVAVGFGLISSPIEEDRDQVADNLRQHGFGETETAEALELADAASAIAKSHFTQGFDRFEALKRRDAGKPWYRFVTGEYTGAMLRMSDADLRRVGQGVFDNVELSWDYDASAVIRRLRVPLLWVFAEADREAPPALTFERLSALRSQGVDVTIYSFPNTDHGMYEFAQAADGSRTVTRITPGYLPLVTDWITQSVHDGYGTARRR